VSWFSDIYADGELSHRAKTVYMYLRDRADAEGKCWPGIKTIAGDLKLSRSTVKRAIADLEQSGYLERTHRFRENGSYTSNLYKVLSKPRPPP
jgi:DNA-binding MarR family transcriptional regulator